MRKNIKIALLCLVLSPTLSAIAQTSAPATTPPVSVDCELNLDCSIATAEKDLNIINQKLQEATARWDACAIEVLKKQQKYAEWLTKNKTDLTTILHDISGMNNANNITAKLRAYADRELTINPVQGQSAAPRITLRGALNFIDTVNSRVDLQPTDELKKLVLQQAKNYPDLFYGVTTDQIRVAIVDLINTNMNGTNVESSLKSSIEFTIVDNKIAATTKIEYVPTNLKKPVSFTDKNGNPVNSIITFPLSILMNDLSRSESEIWKLLLDMNLKLGNESLNSNSRFIELNGDLPTFCVSNELCLFPKQDSLPKKSIYIPLYDSHAYFTKASDMKSMVLLDMKEGLFDKSILPLLGKTFAISIYDTHYRAYFKLVLGSDNQPLFQVVDWYDTPSLVHRNFPIEFRFGKMFIKWEKNTEMVLYFFGDQLCYTSSSEPFRIGNDDTKVNACWATVNAISN